MFQIVLCCALHTIAHAQSKGRVLPANLPLFYRQRNVIIPYR